MRPVVHEPNLFSILHICQRLRQVDADEIYPLLPFDSSSMLAKCTLEQMDRGYGSVIWWDGKPSALIGVHPLHGKACWQVFAFGTDDWKSCAIEIMRESRRLIANALNAYPEAMRLQCDSSIDHTEAHGWLERMGAYVESKMPYYGKDGNTYLRYVWIRSDDSTQGFIRPALERLEAA